MKYTIYDSENGMITGIIDTQDDSHLQSYDGYIQGEIDGNEYYISDGTAVERPELTSVASWDKTTFTADGTDSATITGLPECVVAIVNLDDPYYPTFNDEITDGDLSLSTLTEGTYQVTIDCFPYKKYVVELEAE